MHGWNIISLVMHSSVQFSVPPSTMNGDKRRAIYSTGNYREGNRWAMTTCIDLVTPDIQLPIPFDN